MNEGFFNTSVLNKCLTQRLNLLGLGWTLDNDNDQDLPEKDLKKDTKCSRWTGLTSVALNNLRRQKKLYMSTIDFVGDSLVKNNLPIDERQHSDYASYKTQLSKFEFVTSISCGASSSLTFALGFGYKPKNFRNEKGKII